MPLNPSAVLSSKAKLKYSWYLYSFFRIFFGGLVCVGRSFVNVAHFVFLRDVWIRTQRAAIASRRATNLATHLYSYKVSGWNPALESKR
jgi:hypothetical protein